jgi:divalent metal cation (Fe/Co/Zn/Cd) transporter
VNGDNVDHFPVAWIVLAVEDAAALAGVAIAATGLLVHQLGGPRASDSIASLLIGILLAVTAVGLTRALADLLMGQSIAPARLKRARTILEDAPSVDRVLDLYAVHAAPQEVILAAKVHPADGQTGEELAEALDGSISACGRGGPRSARCSSTSRHISERGPRRDGGRPPKEDADDLCA